MSEYINSFPDDADDEVVFFANPRPLIEANKRRFHKMLRINEVDEPDRIDWLQQYYDNHIGPRKEIAWGLAAKAFFGQLGVDDMLDDDKPPSARFLYVPSRASDLHVADLHLVRADSSLFDDLWRFRAQRNYVADAATFRNEVINGFYKSSPVISLRHAVSGHPYNREANDLHFILLNELFTYIPQNDIYFYRDGYFELSGPDGWHAAVAALAAAEVDTLRAEAVAASLQHAWRVDGPQASSNDPLEMLFKR